MTNAKTVLMITVVLSLGGPPALARFDFNDGQTHNVDYEINDNVWVDHDAPGMETTVNLLNGGRISLSLYPCEDSRINILGGSIEYDVWISGSSQVKIFGGSIGYHTWANDSSQVDIFSGSMKRLYAIHNSRLNFSGGSVYRWLYAYDNAQVNFSGGSVHRWLYAHDSGQVNISGGSIGDCLRAYDNSRINIRGGVIGDILVASPNSIITIQGSDFAVDGQPFGYGTLTSINGGDWQQDEPCRHLTGTLASGEPIDNDFYIGYDARITLVPEPEIEAIVDIDPDTLNLASKGKWITCYICLVEDYDVVDIDPDSILIEDEIEAEKFSVDEQEKVAIAKFSRSEVQGILNTGSVELTITGRLTDGTVFGGTDVIRVINKGRKK